MGHQHLQVGAAFRGSKAAHESACLTWGMPALLASGMMYKCSEGLCQGLFLPQPTS